MSRFLLVFFALLGACYVNVVPDGGLLPRQLLIAAGSLVGLFMLGKDGRATLRISWLEAAFFAWLAWQAVTLSWAINTAEAWATVARWAALGGFYLLIRAGLGSGKVSLPNLSAALCAYLLADSLWILYQSAPAASAGMLLALVQRIAGSHGNKNLLSVSLFLALPWILWAWGSGQRPAVLYRILTVVMVGLLILLQTRSALLGLAVAATAYGLVWLASSSPQASRRPVFIGVGVVVAVVAGLSALAAAGLLDKLAGTESIAERLSLWRNSWLMIRDAPITGVGVGQWQIWMPGYGVSHFNSYKVQMGVVAFQRPHNDYLWLASELGVIGLALYLVFYWGAAAALWRALRNQPAGDASGRRLLFRLSLATLAGYAVLCQFDFPHERPELQLLLLLLIAVGYAYAPPSAQKTIALPVWLGYGLAALGFGLGLPRAQAEHHIPKVKMAARTNNPYMGVKELKKARTALCTVDATTVPISWYVGVAVFQTGDYPSARRLFEEARAVAPNHFLTLNNLASAMSKMGQNDSAAALYRRCIQISPRWSEPWLNLAAIRFNDPAGGAAEGFELMRQFPDTVNDPRWPTFKAALLNGRLRLARPTEAPAMKARIDTLLADRAFPSKAYALYRQSKRSATFWR